MRIVVISDTHMLHDRLVVPDGDLLIHCGDFSNEPIVSEYEEFFSWLAAQPHKHKVLVAGNHDELLQQFPGMVRRRIPHGITYLEDSATQVGRLKIFGSPWTPGVSYMAFTYGHKNDGPHVPEWSMIPGFTDVVVTHGPPRGILDRNYAGQHIGDQGLLARVAAIRPLLHLFGHVHDDNGELVQDGTRFVNAAIGDDDEDPDLSARIHVVDL